MYKTLIFPLISLFDPEKAHYFAMSFWRFLSNIPLLNSLLKSTLQIKNPQLQRQALGISFPNPVGLAAGFDKNAQWIDTLDLMGFGFIEIGTITPKPQKGNPKPRLFRIKSEKALVNRMGFNNMGLEQVIKNLRNRKSDIIVGGNIGKNKNTPNENAIQDYLICFEGLFEYVDYFVINVSSPNTPGLRELQEKEPLKHILETLQKANNAKNKPKPILLKIAPDLTTNQLDDIMEIVLETEISGIVATNTTLDRNSLKEDIPETGGLSGEPLRDRSTEVIRYLNKMSDGKIKIIGVGGIASTNDAAQKLEAGACLVQVYSGFIYEGPGLVKKINRGLIKK